MIVTLLGVEGKWTAIARSGRSSAGLAGKLSLFSDVSVQLWRRQAEDLPLITQVQLNGVLQKLSEPGLYPYAHVLAELADSLTVDVEIGEPLHEYLASGLRGLCRHHDPELVTLLYAWKMLQVAGLAPRTRSCGNCGAETELHYLDIKAGTLNCAACPAGSRLASGIGWELQLLLGDGLRAALEQPFPARTAHWLLLGRYLTWHATRLKSLERLVADGTPVHG